MNDPHAVCPAEVQQSMLDVHEKTMKLLLDPSVGFLDE